MIGQSPTISSYNNSNELHKEAEEDVEGCMSLRQHPGVSLCCVVRQQSRLLLLQLLLSVV
jgi:hypothetical protein